MRAATKEEIERWFPPDVAQQLFNLPGAYVCLSGGVDSSAVMALLAGIMPEGKLIGLNFQSYFHFPHESERAEQLCKALGRPYLRFPGPELQDKDVKENHPNRCGLCKTHRLQWAEGKAKEVGWYLVDGTNATDKRDPTRLGNKAVDACTVLFSPFAQGGIEKKGVRDIARTLGISWADEMATACLATRFPRGVPLVPWELQRAGQAEQLLLGQGIQARLRIYGDTVCLEFPRPVDFSSLPLEKVSQLLKPLGYDRIMVDIDGYVSGREWLTPARRSEENV